MRMKKRKFVVIVAFGGVGEFLFQVDLLARLLTTYTDLRIILLVRSKYQLFTDIIKASSLQDSVELVDASSYKYVVGMCKVWIASFFSDVTIINSFHSLYYRLPTRIFYSLVKIFGGRVIVAKHTKTSLPYEQVLYKEHEMIWQRNNRIVEVYSKSSCELPFPAVHFSSSKGAGDYIHIHPVGSKFEKSYPVAKLLALLESLGNRKIVLSMTPSEAVWYLNEDLKKYLALKQNITLINKYFSFKEIVEYIGGAKVFCTVNTGLVWLAVMLKQKMVVLDTCTDYEWNPSPYENVLRLSHDYDKEGGSLHLRIQEHEDGSFFESMYLVTSDEAYQAITLLEKGV